MNCQYHANGDYKCDLVEGFVRTPRSVKPWSEKKCSKFLSKKIEKSQGIEKKRLMKKYSKKCALKKAIEETTHKCSCKESCKFDKDENEYYCMTNDECDEGGYDLKQTKWWKKCPKELMPESAAVPEAPASAQEWQLVENKDLDNCISENFTVEQDRGGNVGISIWGNIYWWNNDCQRYVVNAYSRDAKELVFHQRYDEKNQLHCKVSDNPSSQACR